MIIYFICNTMTVNIGGSEGVYPTIQSVRDTTGQFPCFWAIEKDRVAGIADVTTDQLTAIQAIADIVVWEDNEKTTLLNNDKPIRKTKIKNWLKEKNISHNEVTDTLDTIHKNIIKTIQLSWPENELENRLATDNSNKRKE